MGVGGSAVQKTARVGVAVRVGSVVPHSGPQAESRAARSNKTAALRAGKEAGFIGEDYTAAPTPSLPHSALQEWGRVREGREKELTLNLIDGIIAVEGFDGDSVARQIAIVFHACAG